MLEINKIHQGDCLELMKDIPNKSVDMILCDLPYGTTACKWDTIIPFDKLWKQYNRIIKDNGAIVLFGSEPFSSKLRMSNIKDYRYDWKWIKERGSGFMNAKKMPTKKCEDILVFYKKLPTYNPQELKYFGKKITMKKRTTKSVNGNMGINKNDGKSYVQEYTNYPNNILEFKTEKGLHPTQKPVTLFEYLIKTYTNKGMSVLDNTCGSGTTAVACLNTERNFICIEKEQKYVKVAQQRIKEVAGCKAEGDNGIPPTNKLLGILPKRL